ncbi:MAG TPA: TolC family protein, partial [Steroidobacteraceae bacterium]|nr:TolC family protein [Steroidobacteraceae bacterium]
QARSLANPRLRTFIAAARASDGKPDSADGTGADDAWDLTTLTLAALYYHPNLDLARARLAEARAGVTTAGQVPNPSVSFEELSYRPSVSGSSAWTIAPVINFLIETFGKKGHRTREAQALTEAAHADLTTVSWQVRGGVRDALMNLWTAQHSLVLVQQRLDLQEQLVRLLDHRFAVGAASALDVARERTNRNQVRLAFRDAERQGVLVRTQLAEAIGIPLAALDAVELSFDAIDQPEQPDADVVSGELRRTALVNRSDVQALLAQYAAAESALALQVANQYPNITLSPGYGYDQGQHKYILLPAADLPVFNQNQGPIAEALAGRDAAAARFTGLQTQVIDAVDGATAEYWAATRTLASADALLADEQDREHRTERWFQAGEADRPTLMTAQLERIAAEQSRFDALAQQRQALGAVEDALQHPFYGPAMPASSDANPRVGSAPHS